MSWGSPLEIFLLGYLSGCIRRQKSLQRRFDPRSRRCAPMICEREPVASASSFQRMSGGLLLAHESFEVRQILATPTFSLCLISEDLLEVVNGSQADFLAREDISALTRTLDGEISCVFGWGSNHHFQLSADGPSPPFQMWKDEIHPQLSPSRLHLVPFRHTFSNRDYLVYRQKLQQEGVTRTEHDRELHERLTEKEKVQFGLLSHERGTDGAERNHELVSEETFEDRLIQYLKDEKVPSVCRTVDFTFRIVEIQVGQDYALALTNDGRLFSWGNNEDGRCGQGPR